MSSAPITATQENHGVLPGDRQIARRMTQGYLMALVLIAAALVGTSLVLSDMLARGHGNAARIVLLDELAETSGTLPALVREASQGDTGAMDAFQGALGTMAMTRERLVHGDAAEGMEALPSGVWAFYFDGHDGIDAVLEQLLSTARAAVEAAEPGQRLAAQTELANWREARLLPALDAARRAFSARAAEELALAGWVQKTAILGLVAILVAVALMIFRPTVRQTCRQFATLERLAHNDALTGLANRRAFQISAERELALLQRGGRDCALLMIDIDHFKKINDRHGHDAGDRALRRFAALATGTLRTSDIVARIGGEEFAVLLSDVDATTALLVADKLRRAMAADAPEDSPAFTVSIGVCPASAGSTLRDLLGEADAALYRAKAAGRDRAMLSAGSPHEDGVVPATAGPLVTMTAAQAPA